MITQKFDPNDPVLGFAYKWVKEISKHVDRLFVICLKKAEGVCLEKVDVIAIKEKSDNKLTALIRFFRSSCDLIFRNKINGIFVHQCPIYVILVYPMAFIRRVPIVLWYTHGHVSFSLRVAVRLVKVVLTATKESCRVGGEKVKVVGHGIDVAQLDPSGNYCRSDVLDGVRVNGWGSLMGEGRFEVRGGSDKILVSVGRISPVKDYNTLIKAVEYLVKQIGLRDIRLIIVGEPMTASDRKYMKNLTKIVFDLGLENWIKFIGAIPHTQIIAIYFKSDVVISASRTRSLDKVILEAMACGKPVLTSLPIKDIFGDKASMFIYREGDYKELADKILYLLNLERAKMDGVCRYLRDIVVREHNLSELAKKIVEQFNK